MAITDPENQAGDVLGVSASSVHNRGTECQKIGTLMTAMKKRRCTNRIEKMQRFC